MEKAEEDIPKEYIREKRKQSLLSNLASSVVVNQCKEGKKVSHFIITVRRAFGHTEEV